MSEIHLKAPRGWINDPNGFIYYNGEYHLFYQHFPYAPKWGRMHWGHAVSRDLTNWEHKEIALFPSKNDDKDGCFSGSAVELDGKLHLFYTGVNYTVPDPENTNCCLNDNMVSAQLHLVSEDGYTFDNFGGKSTVIPTLDNPEIGDKVHTRDPKVWRGSNGEWYMILGTTVGGNGRLLFYKSSDLTRWSYVNSVSGGNFGWMWECPDYFEVNGKGVLIYSPLGLSEGDQTVCRLAEFKEESCDMTLGKEYQFFDYGLDLYAPQSTTDRNGRRVVAAWLRMPEPMRNNTIGMFATPRICEVRNGHICFRPHPDVRGKFTRKTDRPSGIYMLRTTLREGDTLNIGGYIVRRNNGSIVADRTAVFRNNGKFQNICQTPVLKDGFDVEIYVDENMIEVFANDGEYVITNTVYDLTNEISHSSDVEIYTLEE